MADRTYAVVKHDSYKNKFITKEKATLFKKVASCLAWKRFTYSFQGIFEFSSEIQDANQHVFQLHLLNSSHQVF